MTNKSKSLSGPISPRAADPNRTIFSGSAASTIRLTMSARMAGSGLPVRFLRLVFMVKLKRNIAVLPPPARRAEAHGAGAVEFLAVGLVIVEGAQERHGLFEVVAQAGDADDQLRHRG